MPALLIQHQTKGFAPYLHDEQAHHCIPRSQLLHISFLQRGIPWPCRLHSNQHNIRRLHSSPISTYLLHVCWPWPYNAEYSHLGSPVPITKTFLFFSFPFFLFDAPLSSWAVCEMTSSHHTLCCHGTHNTAHKTCAIIIPTASPLSERMGSRNELKPSVIACEGTHTSLVSVLSPLF